MALLKPHDSGTAAHSHGKPPARNKAIAPHSTDTSNKAWDGPENEKRLKTGESEAYYRKAFAWQDPDKDATTKAAYKFIHHEVDADGNVGAANVEGCRAGIEVLNGARGGATIPKDDKKGVYDHLAKHMRDAGVEPPEFKENRAPQIRAAADGTLEMLIYEEIGEDWFGSGLTARTIKQQMDEAGVYTSIRVRINSPGGDAFEGTAIYNLIRAQKKPVEVCVDGIAASSASIIAMAGDTITMGHNAMMMIHNAWSLCIGEASEMRKMADVLDKVSGSIAQTYVDRTGKSMDEIKSLMDAETWMNADECVKEGFATKIAELPGEQQALARARSFRALGKMRHVPSVLKSSVSDPDGDECECPCQSCMDGDCPDCTNTECDDPNCTDCPMQQDTDDSVEVPAGDSNLSLYEARLTMLGRRVA